jgi:hypothetical protein
MWTTTPCQKLHKGNALSRLFPVSEAQAPQPAHRADVDVDVSQAMQAAFSQAKTQLDEQEREKNTTIHADTNRYEFERWLNRAGWARHLRGLKRDWLLEVARRPAPRERALSNVCWAARMVM